MSLEATANDCSYCIFDRSILKDNIERQFFGQIDDFFYYFYEITFSNISVGNDNEIIAQKVYNLVAVSCSDCFDFAKILNAKREYYNTLRETENVTLAKYGEAALYKKVVFFLVFHNRDKELKFILKTLGKKIVGLWELTCFYFSLQNKTEKIDQYLMHFIPQKSQRNKQIISLFNSVLSIRLSYSEYRGINNEIIFLSLKVVNDESFIMQAREINQYFQTVSKLRIIQQNEKLFSICCHILRK